MFAVRRPTRDLSSICCSMKLRTARKTSSASCCLLTAKTTTTKHDCRELQQDEHQGGQQPHVEHGSGPDSGGNRDGEPAEGCRDSWCQGPFSAAGGHFGHRPARHLYPTWSNPRNIQDITFEFLVFRGLVQNGFTSMLSPVQ